MDAAGFREIYERYGGLAWSMIARLGVPERDREDVFMESWEAIFASREAFSGRASLATWIGRIVRNKAVDRLRRKVPAPLSDGDLLARLETVRDDRPPGGGREVIRREAADLLGDFIRKLSPRRRLIVGKWLEGLSYREIAELVSARFGREADTAYVGKELYLARSRLAGMLNAAGIGEMEDIWE